MKTVTIDTSVSGFTYDVDNPTYWTERLSYLYCRFLDSLSTGGIEVRQLEASDGVLVDTYMQGEVSKYAAQEVGGANIVLSDLPDDDFMADGGLSSAVALYRAKILKESEDKANAGENIWSAPDLIEKLEELRVLVELLANREEVLNIGSHQVWTKSACVDEF